jgi:hypothetical protein
MGKVRRLEIPRCFWCEKKPVELGRSGYARYFCTIECATGFADCVVRRQEWVWCAQHRAWERPQEGKPVCEGAGFGPALLTPSPELQERVRASVMEKNGYWKLSFFWRKKLSLVHLGFDDVLRGLEMSPYALRRFERAVERVEEARARGEDLTYEPPSKY